MKPDTSRPNWERICRENTGAFDRFLARTGTCWVWAIREAGVLTSAYLAPGPVLWRVWRNRSWPFIAALRSSGQAVELHSRWDVMAFAHSARAPVRLQRVLSGPEGARLLEFAVGQRDLVVTLEAPPGAGDPTVLVTDPYRNLEVAGRTVLDIGAGVGETAVQFVLKGARRVIACEPLPRAFAIAEANVRRNGMEDRVLLLRKAVGPATRRVSLSSEIEYGATRLEQATGSTPTEVTTLADLVSEFSIDDACLKVDCEGDEYEILGSAAPSTLGHFRDAAVEYHYGPRLLSRQLQRAGFKVRATRPIHYPSDPNPYLYCGMIFGTRASG